MTPAVQKMAKNVQQQKGRQKRKALQSGM